MGPSMESFGVFWFESSIPIFRRGRKKRVLFQNIAGWTMVIALTLTIAKNSEQFIVSMAVFSKK